jgi:hypothetical protein
MPETNLSDPPKQAHSRPSVNGAPPKQTDPKPSLIGVAARLYWMLVGNAILYLFAVAITQRGYERGWVADAGFWAAVGSLVLVRYVDVALLGGATASGGPASRRDWHRYVARLLPVSFVLWIIAHAVARRVSL